MFFDSNEVNNLLNCKKCDGRLDEPMLLSCGSSICSHCVSSIQVNKYNEFECLVCKDKHEMPKNGLPFNAALKDLLSYKPIKESRGKLYDLFQKSLDDIQNKHNFMKFGIENSNDLIKEHFMDLRSDVQLTAEEVILQVNDFSSKIIQKIDEYEKELIKLNKTNSESLSAFKAIVKELESFHTINTEYLKQYEVEDTVLIRSNEKATTLMKKVELEIDNLKKLIFNGNNLKFNKNNEKISESTLGELKIEQFSSSILRGVEKIKDLMILCEFPVDQKWNLIYRASQDGFEAANFHSECDNKPNTLVIIKSENGNIFGGYTEQSWLCETGWVYKADPKSFIYSLINLDNKPLKIKCSNNESIGCKATWGPTFGKGEKFSDIFITDNSNTRLSYSNLGSSYIHPDYAKGSNEAKSFLAGSTKFKVLEIEVYAK